MYRNVHYTTLHDRIPVITSPQTQSGSDIPATIIANCCSVVRDKLVSLVIGPREIHDLHFHSWFELDCDLPAAAEKRRPQSTVKAVAAASESSLQTGNCAVCSSSPRGEVVAVGAELYVFPPLPSSYISISQLYSAVVKAPSGIAASRASKGGHQHVHVPSHPLIGCRRSNAGRKADEPDLHHAAASLRAIATGAASSHPDREYRAVH